MPYGEDVSILDTQRPDDRAEYEAALARSRQGGEPDTSTMIGLPMTQQARQEGEPDPMLGPSTNILGAPSLQDNGALFPPGSQGAESPYLMPAGGQAEPAPAKRGVGMSALLGFFHGLAGAGREHLMNLYEEENATRFTQQKIHANVLNNIVAAGGVITPQMGKAFGLKPDQVEAYNQVAGLQGQTNQILEAQRRAKINFALQATGLGGAPPQAAPAPDQGPGILTAGAPVGAIPAPPPGAPPPPPPGVLPQSGPMPQAAPAPTRQAPGPLVPGRHVGITKEGDVTIGATFPSSLEVGRFASEQAAAQRAEELHPLHVEKALADLRKTQGELQDKQAQEVRTTAGVDAISNLMAQSRATDDPAEKRKLYLRATEIAARAQIPWIDKLLENYAEPKAKPLDISNPSVAESVAATGLDPTTRQPVDEKTRKAAAQTITARKERVIAQNEAVAKIATAEVGPRMAIGGSMKSLVKASEARGEFEKKATQMEGALETMEKNLAVFPTSVGGRLTAAAAKFFQTDRGGTIMQIQQAVNVLQGLEPRFLAGEKGRIPYQLEQQWREVLADPTKHTQATVLKLLSATRGRVADMRKAMNVDVESIAATSKRLGVAKEYVDAFRVNDIDALRMGYDEGLRTKAIPNLLSDEDIK